MCANDLVDKSLESSEDQGRNVKFISLCRTADNLSGVVLSEFSLIVEAPELADEGSCHRISLLGLYDSCKQR